MPEPLSRQKCRARSPLWARWVIIVGFAIAGVYIYSGLLNQALRRTSTLAFHVYELETPLPFLTEDVALALARETLQRAGFDPEAWIPVEDGRTRSPDHIPDKYLVRNTINPNSGTIRFRNAALSATRFVNVELKDKKVTCRVWRPL